MDINTNYDEYSVKKSEKKIVRESFYTELVKEQKKPKTLFSIIKRLIIKRLP